MVSQQNADIADTMQLRDVAMATIFVLLYIACMDLRVTWVCVHNLTWHQNDLKVD